MKVLHLEKIKLGDDYPIIRMTTKTLFGTKKRDVVMDDQGTWVYCDQAFPFYHYKDEALNTLMESSEREYKING